MRVVLDTNVLLDGAHDNFSAQVKLLDAVISGELVALVSTATKREYHRLIRRTIKDQTYRKKLDRFLQTLEEVKPKETDVVIDDEEDRKFVAAALGGGADFIVTHDRHLLDIGEVGKTKIVTPGEAWQKWQEEADSGGEWQGWLSDLGITS